MKAMKSTMKKAMKKSTVAKVHVTRSQHCKRAVPALNRLEDSMMYSIGLFRAKLPFWRIICTFGQGRMSKVVVLRGSKKKTSGGLTKDKLMKNKRGKVVSKADESFLGVFFHTSSESIKLHCEDATSSPDHKRLINLEHFKGER